MASRAFFSRPCVLNLNLKVRVSSIIQCGSIDTPFSRQWESGNSQLPGFLDGDSCIVTSAEEGEATSLGSYNGLLVFGLLQYLLLLGQLIFLLPT